MARRAGLIEQRGEGKWLVRWFVGLDPETGKRQYHSKTVTGSKREAQSILTEKLSEIDKGTYVKPTRATVAAALDLWLEALKKSDRKSGEQKRSARTLADYRMIVDKRIKPRLGHKKLQELTGVEINGFYEALHESGLAPRTVAYTHAVLRASLRWAAGPGLLLTLSPMRHAEAPPQGSGSKRASALSAPQVRAFLEAAKGTTHFALFALLFGTGCRPGEALALRWSDLDLESGVARIERTLSRPGGAYEMRPPKTDNSTRALPLSAGLVRALREHRAVQAEHRLSLGSAWQDGDLVFPGPCGEPADEMAIYRRQFLKLARVAQLPIGTRLYDARHTFATLALTGGIPVHEVSKILGHSTVTLTLNTYSHLLPDRATTATDAVGAAIFQRQ